MSVRQAAKKIPVQLLKDVTGLGTKGEIVQVAAGRMRNELHINNGAAYVIKGQPTKIPITSREEIEKTRHDQLAKAQAEKSAKEKVAKQQAAKQAEKSRQDAFNRITNLQFGGATSKAPKSSPGSFTLETSLRMLPKKMSIKLDTTDGKVMYTIDQACKHVSDLTGTQIPVSMAKFSVRTGPNEDQLSDFVDHIGRYRLIFDIPDASTLSFDYTIYPTEELPDSVPKVRPFGPIAKSESASQSQQASTSSSAEQKPSKNDGRGKKFEWENDLLKDV